MKRAAGTLGPETGEVLDWFGEQSRRGKVALESLEELGSAKWPGKRALREQQEQWRVANNALNQLWDIRYA